MYLETDRKNSTFVSDVFTDFCGHLVAKAASTDGAPHATNAHLDSPAGVGPANESQRGV